MVKTTISIEVVYALPHKQILIPLKIQSGSSILQAIEASNIQEQIEQDISSMLVGIFGRVELKPEQRILKDGDRIEIYRNLIADPKEMRKQRAMKLAAL